MDKEAVLIPAPAPHHCYENKKTYSKLNTVITHSPNNILIGF